MRLVLVHAALLVSALAFAYQTWARDDIAPADGNAVTLWQVAPEEVVSIGYESEIGRMVLEHRRDEHGSYLWATLSAPQVDAPYEFLVGEAAHDLLQGYAFLRALRDIGPVDPATAEEYGFTEGGEKISVTLSNDGTREFLIGETVFGTDGWYVRDTADERVYVFPAELVDGLQSFGGLAERHPHPFTSSDVASLTIRTADGERTMVNAGAQMFGGTTWAPPDAPEETDQTFTNFMERVESLRLMEYAPAMSPDVLDTVLHIEYFDDAENRMGFLELLRDDQEDGAEYYVISEHTRVPAPIPQDVGESLDQDVEQLF